jgi:uncharacterized protein with von Willebrand factor type A (vWA) domain
MKNENTQNMGVTSGSWNKGKGKLESLPEEQRTQIIEWAANARQEDVVIALQKRGIYVHPSTLSRFVRKSREKHLLEEGEEIKETAAALAERGRTGVLREGTIEAVRQRLYERALVSNSPEEARELYAALIAEEAKLKQLELEARKVAVAEQQLKLQELRIQVEMNRSRKRAMVTASESESEAVAVADGEKVEVAQIAGGATAEPLKGGTTCDGKTGEGVSEGEKRLQLVVRETVEVLNGTGTPYDKLQEARERLMEAVKEMG